jgi:hypothetical protein
MEDGGTEACTEDTMDGGGIPTTLVAMGGLLGLADDGRAGGCTDDGGAGACAEDVH